MSDSHGHEPIDYVALVGALLDRASTLVPQWLPSGKKVNGRWYVGDFHGAEGKSANVNLTTGQWIDNGGDKASGNDLLSLYAYMHGMSHSTAARELIRDNGWQQVKPVPPKPAAVPWVPLHPVPADAPDYKTQWGHFARGTPNAHWEYRDQAGVLLGVVCRFDKSDGTKDVQPLAYCTGPRGQRMWRYKAFAAPRPLYGLWRLPGAPPAAEELKGRLPLVVVVEGEKKADRLFEALGSQTPVLGWPGGCKVAHLADWSVLQGFRVLCWPDADSQRDKAGELLAAEKQPGLQAMRAIEATLAQQGTPVRIVDVGPPGTRPEGWDAADAVAEGWDKARLLAFMGQLLPAASPAAAKPSATDVHQERAAREPEVPPWQDDYVFLRGQPRECVPNVMLVLARHAAWQGVLGFDEFAQRVVKRCPAPYDDAAPSQLASDEWSDVDDTRTAAWIARHEGWVPSSAMVAEAANVVARANTFHPVLDWLGGLKHDKTERIDHWMVDHLGVQDTPYARLVSRYFLIGMCMRVIEPGCKFDTCLVLEGPQGRRKSTVLKILGGPWFSDIELDLQNKDAMSNIRGKWLHEFGEMGSLARAESNRQKSFLSRQIDEFRPVYGRREIRCKRQSAFGGSTNEWQWNKDATGGRRFWPVEVGSEINTDGLAAARDQLFAEAYACALAHVADRSTNRYWPTSEEQTDLFDLEQLAREAPDAYLDLLAAWMNSTEMQLKDTFTLADACMSGLKLDTKSLSKDVQTRVGISLRKLGCERVERRTAIPRFVYKRPPRNAASSQPGAAADPAWEEVPF